MLLSQLFGVLTLMHLASSVLLSWTELCMMLKVIYHVERSTFQSRGFQSRGRGSLVLKTQRLCRVT